LARSSPRLTLLEGALIASLLAIVLAIFVPTFARRLRLNKLDEASEVLQQMSDGARAYYDRHDGDCLPAPAGPTPGTPSIDPIDIDFAADETVGATTWAALALQAERPLRFSYEYAPERSGCGLSALDEPFEVSFRAHGDLDGDGVRSTFERRATIDRQGFHESEALLVHQRTE
jgi:hypothetical protein